MSGFTEIKNKLTPGARINILKDRHYRPHTLVMHGLTKARVLLHLNNV